MTQPQRRRTRAREIAIQLLYQFDVRGEGYERELGRDLAALVADESKDDDEVRTFALRLLQGTLTHRDELDQRLRLVARNWDLKRMAIIDRNVLRMAIYELTHCSDIPPKVTINAAIELGQKFRTANSGGFVNGILDRIRIDLEQEAKAARPAEQQA